MLWLNVSLGALGSYERNDVASAVGVSKIRSGKVHPVRIFWRGAMVEGLPGSSTPWGGVCHAEDIPVNEFTHLSGESRDVAMRLWLNEGGKPNMEKSKTHIL